MNILIIINLRFLVKNYEVISSTPKFKSCGPDGIPMEFFKALILYIELVC